MEKKQIQKNKLDLEFQKYTHLLNGIFIFSTTGILGFIGTFIWSQDQATLILGTGVSITILAVAYLSYKRINKQLSKITENLERLYQES